MPPKKMEDMQSELEALKQQLASLQASTRATPELPNSTRLPAIQLITPKLDGKRTYRSWSINIEAIAQSVENIWGIIQDNTQAPASQQQYARSLLLLNMVPSMQAECRSRTSAYEIWTYLRGQFNTNEFADLAIAVRQLQSIRWSTRDTNTDIEAFYQEFKDAQMTIQEVTEQPLHELILISIMLHAVEDTHPEFASLIEAQLSHPSTMPSQKTFEHVFGRFRTEHYRQKARHELGDQQINAAKKGEYCPVCEKTHGKICWTQDPERAPAHLKDYYKRKHEEWKASKKATDGDLRIE